MSSNSKNKCSSLTHTHTHTRTSSHTYIITCICTSSHTYTPKHITHYTTTYQQHTHIYEYTHTPIQSLRQTHRLASTLTHIGLGLLDLPLVPPLKYTTRHHHCFLDNTMSQTITGLVDPLVTVPCRSCYTN